MNRSSFSLTVGLCLLSLGLARAGEEAPSAPRMVEIELVIAEASRAVASDRTKLDLSAPVEKLQATMLDLEKQGQLDSLARVRLASLENSPATVQVGQTTSVVTGRAMRAPGVTTESVSNIQTGLLVSVMACCREDRQITAELSFEHSRLVPNPPAEPDAKDSGPVLPPRLATSTLKTTVVIPDGQTVVVGGADAATSGQETRLVILATARVRDAAR